MDENKIAQLLERYEKQLNELKSLRIAVHTTLAKCELHQEPMLSKMRGKLVHAIETLDGPLS